MTRLFVDSKEIEPPPNALSLDQVLKHIESSHLSPNIVVRRIQIDGLPLMPESFSDNEIQMKLNQIEKLDTIEVYTGALADIVRDSVEEALRYLDRIENDIPVLADKFRDCPEPKYFESLRQLCEGFLWLNLLMDKIAVNFQINWGSICIQGIPASEQRQRFVQVLKQLIDSQERRDPVLMAGVLEYEILPFILIWREILNIILGRIESAQ